MSLIDNGKIPNYENPESQAWRVEVTDLVSVSIASLVVLARCFTKFFLVKSRGWDDYTCLMALCIAIGRTVLDFIASHHFGLGLHFWDVPPEHYNGYLTSISIDAYLYVVAIALAKLSLLFFLYRIFSIDKRFRIAAWITGTILIIWAIITVFLAIFACRPVKASWDLFLYLDPKTVCHPESYEVVNVYGFCNVITDFVLILMPLPLVWRMQMDTRKKIGVALVFASGGFICAVAIIRQYKLYNSSQAMDPSWQIIPTKIWIALEVNIAIIVACLPALTPLLKRIPYLASLIPSSIRSRFSQASAMQRRPWPQKLSGPHGDFERGDRRGVRGPFVGVGEQAGKTSWQAPRAWREAEKRRFEDLHSGIDKEGSSEGSSKGCPCPREKQEKVMELRHWGGR